MQQEDIQLQLEQQDPNEVAQTNERQRIIDHNIEKLQQINLKLRNRIKDLNSVVERALERQSTKIASKANNV